MGNKPKVEWFGQKTGFIADRFGSYNLMNIAKNKVDLYALINPFIPVAFSHGSLQLPSQGGLWTRLHHPDKLPLCLLLPPRLPASGRQEAMHPWVLTSSFRFQIIVYAKMAFWYSQNKCCTRCTFSYRHKQPLHRFLYWNDHVLSYFLCSTEFQL